MSKNDIDMEEYVSKLKNENNLLKKQLKFLLSVLLNNNEDAEDEIFDILNQIDQREEPWLEEMDLYGDIGYTM